MGPVNQIMLAYRVTCTGVVSYSSSFTSDIKSPSYISKSTVQPIADGQTGLTSVN